MVNVIGNNQHTGTKMTILKQSINFFLISIMTAAAYAGEVVEVTTQNLLTPNEKEDLLQILFSEGYVKVKGKNNMDIVFNSSASNMMIISHDNRYYFTIDQDSVTNVKNQIDKAIEQALAQVPPEQREMMEKMMRQQLQGMDGTPQKQVETPNIELRKIGSSEIINNYHCESYEALADEQKVSDFCVAEWSDINASENMQNSFIAVASMMGSFLEQISQITMNPSDYKEFSYLKELKGFPIFNKNYKNGIATDQFKLKSITKLDIDASEFEAPEGYNKQDMMGM